MGTSSSYGGSGGSDWGRLREELEDWLDSLPGVPDGVDETPVDTEQPEHESPHVDPDEPEDEVVDILRPLAASLLSGGRGGADGPSGGGGLGAPTAASGGGRSPSGTGRSRARAGRVGGRLAAGLSALRTGDATALAELGLSLEELRTLDPVRQAQRILAAATEEEVATTLEEEELQTAANRTAIWALTAEEPPDVGDLIRYFVAEYVYEVFLTEGGPALRSGNRNGLNAIAAEDRVKRTITALARQVPIDPSGMGPGELAELVERVLEQALRIHGGDD